MTGFGRKLWSAGDVLASADLNGYLMDQAVMYFDNDASRNASILTPKTGMVTYRADGTVVEVFNGTSWVSSNSVGGTVAATQVVGSITGASINNSNVVTTLTTVAGTAHTFANSNQGQLVVFTSNANVTATLSTATSLSAGQRIDVVHDGAGTVTIASGSGITLAGRGTIGTAYLLDQYDAASLVCVGTNSYRIIGNTRVV
jgi:hypothetical protein